MERLKKLERAAELKAIDRPQDDVDDKQATAMAKLIRAVEKVPNVALQVGTLLVVKITADGVPCIQGKTLSQQEMLHLENNQFLLKNPDEVLKKLADACARQQLEMTKRKKRNLSKPSSAEAKEPDRKASDRSIDI